MTHKIPRTPEELAEASRLSQEAMRNLDVVEDNLYERFTPKCALWDVFLLDQIDVDFRAWVFFKKGSDLEACKRNGITEEIREFIRDDLERVGRGKKEETTLDVQFDS